MRVLATLMALGADLAWNLAGPFWGFTVLACLVLWIALHPNITTGSKAYRTEQRLNAAMPRIPNPQTSPSAAGNSSYTTSNTNSVAGNSSFPLASSTDNIGGADNGNVTGGQIGGASAHYHFMAHGHQYGNFASDFNALRSTVSNHITNYNAMVGWQTAMCTAFNTLQTDHANLVSSHNTLRSALQNTNILQ